MAILNRPQSTTASAQPIAQPTTHAVVQGQTAVVVQQQHGNGCCSVPPDTTQSVKTSRGSSIAVIVIHALALFVLGFLDLFQWVASLIGIIMGSILLCVFSRCCYITATVLFSIGIIFDILAMLDWLYIGAIGVAILPALGAVSFLIGAIATGMAVCNWQNSGAPDAPVIQKEPIQIVQHAPTPSINATVVQPNYSHPAASKAPPPAYSSTV